MFLREIEMNSPGQQVPNMLLDGSLVDEVGVRTFASRHQEDKICDVKMLCELGACQTVFK